ncbi:hypothetical protein BB559_001536 [Furculomyces boomerangus]|uniref:Phosphoribulokinase/uridine kinase domain-containing protein n=1 Tax=Furculomyces boomerangus TaxID=61424 RepID=A0A2T9Z1N9_9FUNG|nr:hypothetical protein BB559_001536 [Furculomyces boomerangus]
MEYNSENDLETLAIRVVKDAKKLNPEKRYLIAIAGIPGSGKTTISEKVVQLINKNWSLSQNDNTEVAISLSMDGFHFPKSYLDKMDAKLAHKRRGAHWTFDATGFVKMVKSLSNKKAEILAPSFDHAKGDPEYDSILIKKSIKIIIVEGLYTLMEKTEPWSKTLLCWNEKWIIKPKNELANTQRLAQRHVETGLEQNINDALERIRINDSVNAKDVIENFPKSFDIIIHN